MKRILVFIIVFFAIGEIMVRIDKSYTILEENRVVKISTDIELTPEFRLLQNKEFIIENNDLRIMVLGDSYIHGGGIEFENNFSQQLKKMFKNETLGFDNVWVLDVSKASANNLDNNRIYFQFVERYKPDIVILGYNYNDVEGQLDKSEQNISGITDFKKTEASSKKSLTFIEKLYKLIYNSEVLHYALSSFHRRLNTFGIIIPNSRFDIVMKSYYLDMENWKKSKILLKEIADSTKENKIEFLVYQFPEINYLDYPQLFKKANKSVKSFFEYFPSVTYIDGGKTFEGENPKNYMLSKYDGHPNEKAHYVMAKDVFDLIRNEKMILQSDKLKR